MKSESMETRCPSCRSNFHVTAPQLQQAAGKVRCGACGAVFDALANMPSGTHGGGAGIKSGGRTRRSRSRSLISDLPETAIELAGRRRPSRGLRWLAGSFAGLLLLAAQYLWFERHQLAWTPTLKPYYDLACEWLTCSVALSSRPDLLITRDFSVAPHPKYQGVLELKLTLVNQAEFSQTLPDISLRFMDLKARVIAARRFNRNDYQTEPQAQAISAGSELSLLWSIAQPGKRAVSYEVDLLAPID